MGLNEQRFPVDHPAPRYSHVPEGIYDVSVELCAFLCFFVHQKDQGQPHLESRQEKVEDIPRGKSSHGRSIGHEVWSNDHMFVYQEMT